jgi:two-component system, sensor histidine kinase
LPTPGREAVVEMKEPNLSVPARPSDDVEKKLLPIARLARLLFKRRPPRGNASHVGSSYTPEAVVLSQPLEAVLDQTTIRQLRDTLTPEMRRQLLDTFDAQQESCMRDLDGAVQRGDRGEIRRVAHMLKGSSASLGATRLRVCCEGLERVSRRGDPDVERSNLAELRVVAAAARDALRQQLI